MDITGIAKSHHADIPKASSKKEWGNAKRGIPLANEEAVDAENPQNSFDARA